MSLELGEWNFEEVDEQREELKNVVKYLNMVRSSTKPIIWERLEKGFRIEDYRERYIDDVAVLLERYYIPDDPLLASTQLGDDLETSRMYISRVSSWLKHTQSLLAVKEGNKEIIGVLIGRVVVEPQLDFALNKMDNEIKDQESKDKAVQSVAPSKPAAPTPKKTQRKSMGFKKPTTAKKSIAPNRALKSRKSTATPSKRTPSWKRKPPIDVIPYEKHEYKKLRVFEEDDEPYNHEALDEAMRFQVQLYNDHDIWWHISSKMYYRVYILCINKLYRHLGIGRTLLHAAWTRSNSFNLPISGIFNGAIAQRLFYKCGGEIVAEMKIPNSEETSALMVFYGPWKAYDEEKEDEFTY